MMRLTIVAVLLASTVGVALADGTCASNAIDKKLNGAAKTSFMTKCQKDAAAACDIQVGAKKLAGAAKTSFTKKCLTDAVGG